MRVVVALGGNALLKRGEPMTAENQLRGAFHVTGAKGRLRVWFSLSPEREPRVQELELSVTASK